MSNSTSDLPAGTVMTFGRAPRILGVVGALVGAAAVLVFQIDIGFGPPSIRPATALLAGLVFGAGTGWLTGLIGSMGWLGE